MRNLFYGTQTLSTRVYDFRAVGVGRQPVAVSDISINICLIDIIQQIQRTTE